MEFLDEPGIDAGGLEREWFTLCCEQLFETDRGLFLQSNTEGRSYDINPNSGRIVGEEHLAWYQFTGRLLGKVR